MGTHEDFDVGAVAHHKLELVKVHRNEHRGTQGDESDFEHFLVAVGEDGQDRRGVLYTAQISTCLRRRGKGRRTLVE